uniref:NADH dehydrogenase subunit 4L n=1 Tax=Allorhynchium sp. GX TaxID=2742723 RepID=A0A6M9AWG8_9HYME|nr:NADH dehydrogenase subunit 4L [Allorhynchium sp. GX]QKK69203.1 NADH dehydrogenase subunit 4L [Allorhynchium sp. GX]
MMEMKIFLVVMILILIVKFMNHFFLYLMCMEFLVLTILFIMYEYLNYMNLEYFYLIFMVMFVLEGVMGLIILLNFIYYKGSDMNKNLLLMMW